MTRQEIVAKLRESMRKASAAKIQWETVTEETPIASLGFDSLSILDLIYDLQQDFNLEFEPQELAGVRTVAELVDFLAAKGA